MSSAAVVINALTINYCINPRFLCLSRAWSLEFWHNGGAAYPPGWIGKILDSRQPQCLQGVVTFDRLENSVFCRWNPSYYIYPLTWRRNKQQRQETNLRTCAPREDSDQTAHTRSLIRIFTGRILDYQGRKVFSCRQRKLYLFMYIYLYNISRFHI